MNPIPLYTVLSFYSQFRRVLNQGKNNLSGGWQLIIFSDYISFKYEKKSKNYKERDFSFYFVLKKNEVYLQSFSDKPARSCDDDRVKYIATLHVTGNTLLTDTCHSEVGDEPTITDKNLEEDHKDRLIHEIIEYINKHILNESLLQQCVQKLEKELAQVPIFKEIDLNKETDLRSKINIMDLIQQLHQSGLLSPPNYEKVMRYQSFSGKLLHIAVNLTQSHFDEVINTISEELQSQQHPQEPYEAMATYRQSVGAPESKAGRPSFFSGRQATGERILPQMQDTLLALRHLGLHEVNQDFILTHWRPRNPGVTWGEQHKQTLIFLMTGLLDSNTDGLIPIPNLYRPLAQIALLEMCDLDASELKLLCRLYRKSLRRHHFMDVHNSHPDFVFTEEHSNVLITAVTIENQPVAETIERIINSEKGATLS